MPNTVSKIAQKTRIAVVDFISSKGKQISCSPNRLDNACGIAAFVLTNVLYYYGFEAEFVIGKFNGWDHAFVLLPLDGVSYYIDITATQFNIDQDVFIVQTTQDSRYNVCIKGAKAVFELQSWCLNPFKNLPELKEYLSKHELPTGFLDSFSAPNQQTKTIQPNNNLASF